jgi:hypothetical protein
MVKLYSEPSMCGYTAIQAVSWIGERVCYQNVVVVVVVAIIIIIIPKHTYFNTSV